MSELDEKIHNLGITWVSCGLTDSATARFQTSIKRAVLDDVREWCKENGIPTARIDDYAKEKAGE